MSQARQAQEVLDRDYFEVRSRILDIAASLDRLDRAAGTPDDRKEELRRGIEALLTTEPGRAEAVQQIFSLEYDPQWRQKFELDAAR